MSVDDVGDAREDLLLSVVLPVRNGANFLAAAIESVLAQTWRDFELIVSDNCSTDETAAIAAEATGDPRVRHVRCPEPFAQADSISFAVDQARGRWISILCHDDLFEPGCLGALAEAAKSAPERVGLIGHGERWLFANGVLHGSAMQETPAVTQFIDGREYVTKALEGGAVPPLPSLTTALVRRAAWQELRPFDARFHHFDTFFWLGVMLSWSYGYLPEALSVNRIHAAQVAADARRSLGSMRDHDMFWPEFLEGPASSLSLSAQARLRTRLKGSSAAAVAVGAELLKRNWTAAALILWAVPMRKAPGVALLLPIVLLRERKRTADLRRRVPVSLIYP